MDCILEEIQPRGSIHKYIGWPVCFMGSTTKMAPINEGRNNLGPRLELLWEDLGPRMNYLEKI
jgi:hypothetical protein